MMYNKNIAIEYDSILNKPPIEECEEYLQHHGVKGQKWGVRRYKNYNDRKRNDFKNKMKKEIVKRGEQNERLNKKSSKTMVKSTKTRAKANKQQAKVLEGLMNGTSPAKTQKYGKKLKKLNKKVIRLEKKNNKIQKKVMNNTTFIATMRKDFKTIERLEVSEKRYK